MDPVLNLEADFKRTSINKVPYLDYLAIIIPVLLPKDRQSPEELKGVVPVIPGPKNLKDLAGGVPGVLKGIVVDNVLPIYGAQPLSGRDQPFPLLDFQIEAAFAVAESGRSEKRNLLNIDAWPDIERRVFFQKLEDDFRLRAAVASTVEGRALLARLDIRLTPNDIAIADALQVKRETAAKKKGGANPVANVVNNAGNAVVNAINQLDVLFASNPPDP
jgi:hypothetical protein